MPRKIPFSGKQKKKQLQERKNRKKDGPSYLAELDDDDDTKHEAVTYKNDSKLGEELGSACAVTSASDITGLKVEKIHQQPQNKDRSKLDINSFRLHFFKESGEVINKKKKEARKPVRPVDEKHLETKLEDVYPNNTNLDFPKRPPWNYSLSKEQLDQQERQYFKNYISDIVNQPRSQELSYFELNLETWRQLWRVLEISDILLVIADIRYPVLHIPPSLIHHVMSDLHKKVIIILNKVDFVPALLALSWKQYLDSTFPGIKTVFFSSFPRDFVSDDISVKFNPSAAIYKKPFQGKFVPVGPPELLRVCKDLVQGEVDLSSWDQRLARDPACDHSRDSASGDGKSEATSAVTQKNSQSDDTDSSEPQEHHGVSDPSSYSKYKNGVLTIGCIGYPNAGKSSVLNALVGRKVVSVSKTPGHTKHLQTIFLTPTVKLCDCPGLVFPSMVPKSLQVIAGIFPVAQVREPYSVVGYLAKRLDLPNLLKIQPPTSTHKKRDKNSGEYVWSAFDICEAWALKNGFVTSKAGRPDGYRAANKILRMAVEGQLCLCFRPPNYIENSDKLVSNPEVNQVATLINRRVPLQLQMRQEDVEEESEDDEESCAVEKSEESDEDDEKDNEMNPDILTDTTVNRFQDLDVNDELEPI